MQASRRFAPCATATNARTGLFFAEGLHLTRAAEGRAVIKTIVYSPEGRFSAAAEGFIRRQSGQGASLLEVSEEVFRSLVSKDCGQSIGAVARQKWTPLDTLNGKEASCWVALEAVQYPGNLGTILRTADAVGGGGVLLLDNATDPYDPASVRASMGGVFSQRLVRATSVEFGDWAAARGLSVVGATPDAPTDYREFIYPRPVVLLMGRERGGLSPSLTDQCQKTIRIPMTGQCDSLNLAVATAIALYGIYHQHYPT